MSTPQAPSAPAAASATPTQATQPQAETATQSQPTPAEIRKMKLKINGQDVEMPESEVVALAQQGKVATQRFQEAAKLRQEADQILKFAKDNPKEFFNKTGMNAREWAEKYLLEELQNEAMSPEQRKARENEERLRRYENQEKDRKEQERQAQMKRMEQEHMQAYDQMFVKALAESGLPKTPFTIKRMAELQLINIKNKYELGASQLAKIVREDYMNEQKALVGGFDGDQLMEFLGPELVKKLSKAQIAKLKAKATPGQASAPIKKKQEDTTGLTWEQWQRRNRGRG